MRYNFTCKYLERFKNLKEEAQGLFQLTGRRMLIEPLEMGEIRSESGLILTTPDDHVHNSITSGKAHVGIVLLTGDDSKLEGTLYNIKAGDVVLVSGFGVKPYTTFPGILSYTEGAIELTTVDEVQLVFPGIEAYAKAIEILNRA